MKAKTRSTYHYITTQGALTETVSRLEAEPAIAVDLEADSMYHYREKVCLIQIATPSTKFIIDPLCITKLTPLRSIFANPDLKKVFHGADYDIRSLYRDFKYRVSNLFDTQIACLFLGMHETGLDAVLQHRFQVTLNKKFQRKDWSKRPLPDEMLTYAAEDVHYLIALSQMLEKELKQKGRLEWVREECADLSKVRPVENDHDPLFLNFKGAGKLEPQCLAVLEALLQQRKAIARKKDKPLFKIFGSRSLMTLATKQPTTLEQLEQTGALSRKQINMYGEAVIDTIQKARQIPQKKHPVYPRKKPPVVDPAIPRRIRALKIWRDKCAKELSIQPGILFSKALLAAIASKHPQNMRLLRQIEGIKRWQVQTFGKDILTILKTAG